MIYPVRHDPATSVMKDFMKRLTGDGGPKKYGKPKMRIFRSVFAKKDAPSNMCGNGPSSSRSAVDSPELIYTMTRTCITPAYHSNIPPPPPPPPLSFCCKLLYIITLVLISAALLLSTACVFGFAKQFDKLTGVKIPCRELFFVFLTLFPAPGAAATQGLVERSIQVAVHTNASTSTTMAAVDTVASWAQLVTACAAPSATSEIDFRLVLY
jgi:hypothetical protein